jgi:hypothetical protein
MPPQYRPVNVIAATGDWVNDRTHGLQFKGRYSGVTRGKRLVGLVGQKKAVAIAIRNVSGRRRGSKLAEWLSADHSKSYGSD